VRKSTTDSSELPKIQESPSRSNIDHQVGQRFWYTTYNEAIKQMMEGLEGIAAD